MIRIFPKPLTRRWPLVDQMRCDVRKHGHKPTFCSDLEHVYSMMLLMPHRKLYFAGSRSTTSLASQTWKFITSCSRGGSVAARPGDPQDELAISSPVGTSRLFIIRSVSRFAWCRLGSFDSTKGCTWLSLSSISRRLTSSSRSAMSNLGIMRAMPFNVSVHSDMGVRRAHCLRSKATTKRRTREVSMLKSDAFATNASTAKPGVDRSSRSTCLTVFTRYRCCKIVTFGL
mmetsp:Transcript_80113/g.248626  ORF Transcript_80113/g.248626 Transcript_80113/m.248626 type:complete len:229 (-) Transcript_80113:600-1286(-)